jgi:hypothetical protein
MLEFLIPLAVLAALILVVRRVGMPGWLSQLTKWLATIYAVVCVFFLGVGVFLWNPINNQTNKGIWFSWDGMLSNACIVVGVILGEWLSLRLIWKKSKHPSAEPSASN